MKAVLHVMDLIRVKVERTALINSNEKTRKLQFNSTNEISCMLRCDSFIGSIRHYLSFL